MSQLELEMPRPRYIVDRTFQHSINGATIRYEAGRVIEDQSILPALLSAGVPISQIKNEDDLLVCPHCGKSSSLAAQQGARALLRRARRVMSGHV